MKHLRPHVLPIVVACVAGGVTVAIATVPEIDFAYRRPTLHVALETAACLVALLAAFLGVGRFLRNGRVADLALVCGLATLAGANLVGAFSGANPARFATWAPIAARVVGSGLIALAAYVPAHRIVRRRHAATWAFAGLGLGLAAIVGSIGLLGDQLPIGVEAQPTGDPGKPDLNGHPVVVGVQLVTMSLYATAAVGFARRAARGNDGPTQWLAVGAVCASFAWLNYVLYPSLYSDFVYTGDLFRLLFYVALVIGAAREIRGYWENAARAAVLDERRRIARDLHDGAAQELSLILRRLRGLRSLDDAALAPVIAAAERGLDDSRRAITALTRPLDEPVDAALAQAVEQVAARSGIRLVLDLAGHVEARPEVREALVRIACEAVNNAANHSGADMVSVTLADGEHLVLRVVDAGRGFDPVAVEQRARGGFGLTSMRERAAEVGCQLRVIAAPGEGTRIEVEVT